MDVDTINGEVINMLWYADDTVLTTERQKYLEVLLNSIRTVSSSFGLCMNIRKSLYELTSILDSG